MDVLDLHARENVRAHINKWTHGLIHMVTIFLQKIARTGMVALCSFTLKKKIGYLGLHTLLFAVLPYVTLILYN